MIRPTSQSLTTKIELPEEKTVVIFGVSLSCDTGVGVGGQEGGWGWWQKEHCKESRNPSFSPGFVTALWLWTSHLSSFLLLHLQIKGSD